MDKIILINKNKNMTSHDVCDKVSNLLKEKKVGHFGTLDPMATGLLVIGLGSLTKIGDLLPDKRKEYVVEVLVGTSTDTYDITGNIIKNSDSNYNLSSLESTLNSFIGTYNQEVPIYSAVKVDGKKLYEYARSGETVTLPKKEVTIFDISDISIYSKDNKNYFSFKVLVSSGTYIRSLINDISKKMNIPMCMNDLCRTKACGFDIKSSYSLSDLEKGEYKLLDITEVLDIEVMEIPKSLENSILNGNKIDKISDKYILFRKGNKNISLYGVYNGYMKPFLTFKK